MGLHVYQATGDELAAAVDRLLAVEPWLDYAKFEPFTAQPAACRELHRQRWLAGTRELPTLVCGGDDGTPLAALRLVRREFESGHFGIVMMRAEPPLGVPDLNVRYLALSALYKEASRVVQAHDCVHFASRLSTCDAAGAWAVQENGARHVDTQVSWMANLQIGATTPAPPPAPTERLVLRTYGRQELASLPVNAWRDIHDYARYSFDRGPLVFDLSLPRDRALGVYAAWTEQAMTGRWADAVVSVWDGERIVAFVSVLDIADLSRAAGRTVIGRGLAATLPGYRGLFTAIQREMLTHPPLSARDFENETQVSTIASINVYAKLGFRYERSTSTFHQRFDNAGSLCT